MNASIKNNRTFYTNTLTWVYTNTLTWELIGTVTWVHTNSLMWELIGNDNGLTWVYTNTPMWELIGTVTWVYTNTLTRELNRYRRTRPDRTGPDRTGPDGRCTLNLSFYRKLQEILDYSKGGLSAKKGCSAPLFSGKWGSRQKFDTDISPYVRSLVP